MNNFKTGDLVVCLNNHISPLRSLRIGDTYTVQDVNSWAVRIEGHLLGHTRFLLLSRSLGGTSNLTGMTKFLKDRGI
jgi:hypothetical protein